MAFQYKQEYERYRRYYQSLEPILQRPSAQAYTTIIFSFLAVSLFGWFAIRPTMQTIFTLKREILDKTEISKKMEDKISTLIEAQAAYQDVQDQIPLLNQALPQTPDAILAAKQLQSLARDTGVAITNLTSPSLPLTEDQLHAGATPTVQKMKTFVLTLSVLGPYANMKQFLLGIATLRRVMTINSISFAPAHAASVATVSANTGTLVLIDLKLIVYYLGI